MSPYITGLQLADKAFSKSFEPTRKDAGRDECVLNFTLKRDVT